VKINTEQGTSITQNNVVPLVSTQTLNIGEIESRLNTLIPLLSEEPQAILIDSVVRNWFGKVHYDSLTQGDINKVSSLLYSKMPEMGLSYKEICSALSEIVRKDDLWAGISCYVGEDKGRIYIERSSAKGKPIKEFVSNFVLNPIYTLEINNKDLNETFYVYDLLVTTKPGRKYTVKLTSSDFNNLKDFQTRLREQASQSGCAIHDAQMHMRGLHHRYVTLGLASVDRIKTGTCVLGYERLTDDGKKYFCATNGQVYDEYGDTSEELVYVGSQVSSVDISLLDSLTHLEYDKEKWYNDIAPTFMKEAMKLHTRDNMLLIIGWMAALPHEYNIRQVHQAFPLLHVAGQQGAGKSTIIQALKPFMGYKSDSIDNFPSAPAMTKSATIGYTIPLVYDEYGGSEGDNGWSKERYNQTHLVMKEIYAKNVVKKLGKGEGGQGSFVYKMRSSLITLGQSFLSDLSIATRAVQVYVYSAFHSTDRGRIAKQAASNLRDMKNKNFWTGFNLWAMRQDDDTIREQLRYYETQTSALNAKGSRQKNVASTIMLGLHMWHKMALEIGLSEAEIGYTAQDILSVPQIMSDNIDTANGGDEESNILLEFLRDVGNDGYTVGNTSHTGSIYGKGFNVSLHTPNTAPDEPGKYGKSGKDACVFGQDMILIDIDAMCTHINRKFNVSKYKPKDLNVYIQSAFELSKQNQGKGLVLAPNGYQVRVGSSKKRYTAFNKSVLADIVPEFEMIKM